MLSRLIYQHRLRILAAGLGLLVIYQLLSHDNEVIDSVINTNEKTPINDPLNNLVPTQPEGSEKHNVQPDILDDAIDENGKQGSKELSDDGILQDESKPEDSDDIGEPVDNSKQRPLKDTTGLSPEILKSIKDYTIFFNDFKKYSIKSPSIKDHYMTEKAAEKFSSDTGTLFSKEYLENVLDIPEATFDELKTSHLNYVNEQIPKLIELYQIATFGNILKTDPEWNSYRDTKGYVIIGGGRFSWLSYLVIKQIRATGSTLPVELFIPSSAEYEEKFCEELLPKYNAKCNVFDDKLVTRLENEFNLGGYQYKMLAILTSRFENVIYLDSDNFPVRNPETILESDIYKETGLILWPDAWARTTNPKFYDIAGVEVKENKIRYSKYDEAHDKKPLDQYTFADSWYHDFEGTLPDPTSETGMMVVNKTKQVKTLLLSLYYNVFGPNHYYPLMTQGSAGEGDKETFIAAAHVLGEPWFQTLKQFKWVGYILEEDQGFKSKALGHYNPMQSQSDPEADIDLMFMHLSYPKYYPNWLVDNNDLVYPQLGNHIRMYKDIYSNVGYDFDLRVLQFFTQGICDNYYDKNGKSILGDDIDKADEYMGNYLHYVSAAVEEENQRCENVFIPHLKWLRETTEFPNSIVQPHGESFY